MAWQLRDSLTTQSLPGVADKPPAFSQLEAGDALDYPAAHALLFGGWTDRAKGDFVYYSESRSGRPARKESANIHDSRIAGHPRMLYVPLRYKKIVTPPTPATPAPTRSAPQPVDPGRTGSHQVDSRSEAHQACPSAVPQRPRNTATGSGPPHQDLGPRHRHELRRHRQQAVRPLPRRSAVYQYTGKGDTWNKIGGAATNLYTGPSKKKQSLLERLYGAYTPLFATNPATGDLYEYSSENRRWTKAGGPGATFAVTDENLYGLTPTGSPPTAAPYRSTTATEATTSGSTCGRWPPRPAARRRSPATKASPSSATNP